MYKFTIFLTKGDNNSKDDRGLNPPDKLWLDAKDMEGKVRGIVSYLGIINIVMNNFPKLKYATLAAAFLGFHGQVGQVVKKILILLILTGQVVG